MRKTTGPTRPAACRGLGAAVLLALFALLHATFSPGLAHLAALDLDGCRQHAALAKAHECDLTPPTLVIALGAEGHHEDRDSSQSCDASAPGSRQLGYVSPVHAVSDTAADAGTDLAMRDATPTAKGSLVPVTSSRPDVLRC
ncbi:hypothetical protein [Streptomyces sp. NRRL S-146]|uniref:hypothetical protein n=1 Tax=Streptomyces sp. NRRL S-146 TaxID=1463884 RepID=UPI0004C6FC4E|nr:hypothetical protein [Streptomyces sp. NRRL S-146]